MIEASQQRDLAKLLAGQAQDETKNTKRVTDFLVDTLALTDPAVALDPNLSVQTLLDRAAKQVETKLAGQPRSEARVRFTIGRAYTSMSQHEQAATHLLRGVELVENDAEFDQGELYRALWEMTEVAFRLQRDDSFAWANRARQVGLRHLHSINPQLASPAATISSGRGSSGTLVAA